MSEMEERLLVAVEKLAEKVERMGLIQEKLEAMDKKLENLAGGAAGSTVSDRDPNPDAGRDLVGDSRTTSGNNSKSSSVTTTQG
uniref:Uncharacterized protein n=1 Tax=Oryza barthii TaxID=65489 RepID=A0A0D3FAP9_9ORYZ